MMILALCACTSMQPSSASFQAMDTLMSLKVYGGNTNLCDTLKSRIQTLDGLLDATDEKSEIARLNAEKSAAVSEDTDALLQRSLTLCEQLGDSFDITVCPAVRAWGFTTGDYRIPSKDERKALADRIDYRRVKADHGTYTLSAQTELDLGAVAKGYAADISADLLRDGGAQAAVLNLGGTIALYGKKPDGSRFSVGIADPENPAAYFGTLDCDACVVATSGGYERYFERDGKRYIHILDPKTAAPVENGVRSVTIVTDDGTRADALSTALFVMGLDKATDYYRAHRDFDLILLTENDELYLTEGIFDDFSLSDGYDYIVHRLG